MVLQVPLLDPMIDLVYTLVRYRSRTGQWPNLIKPKTFNERLSHRKLFDRNPLITQLADKLAVRDYIAERIDPTHLTKLLFVTEEPTQIDFEQLPERFVIKATHGSGFNIIVKDKSQLDREEVVKRCQSWLSTNYYSIGREWCYKNVRPRIMIEEFLQTDDGEVPADYKFFCFGGVPKFIQVDVDRFTEHKRNIYDTAWNLFPVALEYANFDWKIEPPSNLAEMIQIAEKLASELDFIRVDLYSVGKKVFFGEMTNYPENGMGRFSPPEYDLQFGREWKQFPN